MQAIQSTEKMCPSIIDNTTSYSHDGVALILTEIRNRNDNNTLSTDDNVDGSIEAATDNITNEQDTNTNENIPKEVQPKKSNNLEIKHMEVAVTYFFE